MTVAMHLKDKSEVFSIPLAEVDVSNPRLFEDNSIYDYLERLRNEDPVHYCPGGRFGEFWSVTKYKDIISVDSNHKVFSSDLTYGGPTLIDGAESFKRDRFMASDPPKHDEQRKIIAPVVGPSHLAELEGVIRTRAGSILDSLPINENFDWVDRVSIELTTQMLATLFDFPWEERRLLARWSNIAMAIPESGVVSSYAAREAELMDCYAYFRNLWDERKNLPPKQDFISAMVHSQEMGSMPPNEILGNIILLMVGGNDTTRSSISAGILALNQNPAEYDKLRSNHGLIPNMVSEIIRWQTPLSHMCRTALEDIELGGKLIKKGQRVVMWYISGNRDRDVIANADSFLIDRKQARQHLSFGFGIHRCVGSKLAEMQLKILWEEILKRFPKIELVSEPVRSHSNFVHGFESMIVRIAERI